MWAEQSIAFDDHKATIINLASNIRLKAQDNDQIKWILDRAGISDLEGLKVDFAGKYSVFSVGCGTACQVSIAINLETGNVIGPIQSSLGMCYQKDSRLFITNPDIEMYGDEIPEWAFTYYYLITDDGFELLKKSKSGFSGQCD